MGTSLTGLTPSTTYDALIKVGDNGAIDGTLKTLSDGLGNDLPLQMSSTDATFTGNLNISRTINLGAGSTNPSIENIAYTINNSGAQTGTATGIFLNATETALNGQTHNLLDLQKGGVSQFSVSNSGGVFIGARLTALGTATHQILGFGLGSNFQVQFAASADGVLRLQDGDGTSFGRIQLGGTTSSFPSIKRNGTAIDFRLANDSAFCGINTGNINVTGFVLISANLEIGGSSYMGFGNRSLFRSPSDGVLTLLNYDSNDFSRLQFGGTTSSFPSIKRNATGIDFRLADDTAFCPVATGVLSIQNTVASAVSVASTHKVTISIGGTTYYLLASNV